MISSRLQVMCKYQADHKKFPIQAIAAQELKHGFHWHLAVLYRHSTLIICTFTMS